MLRFRMSGGHSELKFSAGYSERERPLVVKSLLYFLSYFHILLKTEMRNFGNK